MLPPEVSELLAGEPGDDAWEPVAHLLTTDEDGYPRVCLLSRAELATSSGTGSGTGTGTGTGTGLRSGSRLGSGTGAGDVGCVVRARHTVANLRRDGRALLMVTSDVAAHYVRLRAREMLQADDGSGRAAVAFDVTGAQADSLGIPLRPMMFRASARVRHLEHWDSNREFLERLGFG
ncbi:MAG: hypothetical protein ACRDN0_01970 [Trebonia sp.]